MTTNDPQRKIPTPADLDPARAAMRAAAMDELAQDEHETPTPAAVAPAITQGGIHRVPVVELSKEQRIRVEALHAARRVVGNPHTKGGQIATAWARQTVELADFILSGVIDRGPASDDGAAPEKGEAASTLGGSVVVGLDDPIPAGTPAAVAQFIDRIRSAVRSDSPSGAGDLEDHVKAQRDYVDRYLDKPDGCKELNAQGIFPVWGSEPPRSEPVHDVTCRRWIFSAPTGQWKREDITAAESRRPGEPIFAPWSPALAEHGPFHACRS